MRKVRTSYRCYMHFDKLMTTRYFEKAICQETCILCNVMASNPIRHIVKVMRCVTYSTIYFLPVKDTKTFTLIESRGGGVTSILGGRVGLAPKFASEILVRAPNFASKNMSDKYPKFCSLNFIYDPKIGTFSNFCVLW